MADAIIHGMHGCSREDEYVRPADPLVQQRLEWFQDQKLALMMHFGVYSQLGICESWPLSDGDAEWSRDGIDWERDGQAFREQYRNLNKSFNPVRLQPEKWADIIMEKVKSNPERKNAHILIKQKGYDISDVTSMLIQQYKNMINP